MQISRIVMSGLVALGWSLAPVSVMAAPSDCTFVTKNNVMKLQADCTTDHTIIIPAGQTLNGQGHTITAVDPAGGHFLGAVVKNGGNYAQVKNLTVIAENLTDACDAGADRLRGILFDGAAGEIRNVTVQAVNQGQSGCQEGNGIEVRNFGPGDSDITTGSRLAVLIANNTVDNYQKTGIIANGYLDVTIRNNTVGQGSVVNTLIAANSIQLAYNAAGNITNNDVEGNQWCGADDYFATALLIYQASAPTVTNNKITGNSDVGIDVEDTHGATVNNNRVRDNGTDCNQSGYDIGISNYFSPGEETNGADNTFNRNTVSGFTTPYDNTPGRNNKSRL